ncbi:unnamed protein product [Arctia plantaginis]|uniref:HTH psq-type domain-containing protein n=1 Tax=Arctia plantaginis TaxID=874455 RepID=A0A8S0YTP5_ARCPL|nr:unnamed protein product [Arctia plantaginis]
MVRNYVKNKDTGPKYTDEKLNIALNDIMSGVLTTHKASVIYGIPFATLYSRVKGTRGAIKKTKGRRTALREHVENILATSIKTLAKWGFGLSLKEILDLVDLELRPKQFKSRSNKFQSCRRKGESSSRVISTSGRENTTFVLAANAAVELALAKEITIIKLPAHTSDLLQPLDVSVFKSFKQKWDKTVASFQRQNIGQRLPKSLFSQFLGETWLISLERWEKRQKETQDTAQDNIAFVEDVEYAEHNVNAPSPSISSSSAFEEVTPATTNLENQPDFTSPPLDPKEKITSEVQNQTVTSLEQMILATIQQKHPSNKQKKRKVASGAEVITSAEMLTELRNKETIKTNKKQTGLNRKPSKKGKGKKVTRNFDEVV